MLRLVESKEEKTNHWKSPSLEKEYLFFTLFLDFAQLLQHLGFHLFWGNSASNCKCLDYPLEVNRVMCIWEIYLLIPSTWNNLDELNLLITHQKTSAKAWLRLSNGETTSPVSGIRPFWGVLTNHGAAEDKVHPAAAGAPGPGVVAAVLAGCLVRDVHLLSGCLPKDRTDPQGWGTELEMSLIYAL